MEIQLEKRLMEILAASVGGLTPGALNLEMRSHFPGLTRTSLQLLLKRLIADGRLIYTQRLGSTRIALGGCRPTRVSERIYLAASPHGQKLPPDSVCVRLLAGTAFGAGDHPTTCMMLRALEQALARTAASMRLAAVRALDVGTGNGVLAIAALLLGAGAATGVDIDPQACHEARINASHNGVAERFAIVSGPVQAVGEAAFDLVLANLRPPTLAALLPVLGLLVAAGGWLILSGFRADEQPNLERMLPMGFDVVWRKKDRDWAATVACQG